MSGILVLDVGGSFIKYGLADAQGHLRPETVAQTPSHAEESAACVLDILTGIVRQCGGADAVSSACVSTAGPFDFDAGVSRMKHKFPALYGVSLRKPFEDAGIPVSFVHDSTAFILGEYDDGVLSEAKRPCCVMLGTGLGFACMCDGLTCVDATQTPALALWKTPFRDGIAEDYVSTRAIQQFYGEPLPVKEIAQRARRYEQRAMDALHLAGRNLADILIPVLSRLSCDRFALGGQIARSADLLGLELPVPWSVSAHLDDAALRGACRFALLGRTGCVRIYDPQAFYPAQNQ